MSSPERPWQSEPSPWPAASPPEFAIVAVAQQGVVVRIRFEINVAAVAAVAARRAAARNILLPAEGHAAIAAVAGLHRDFGFVSKHDVLCCARKSSIESIRQGWEEKQKYAPGNRSASSEIATSSWLPRLRRQTLCSLQPPTRGFFGRQDADESALRALVFEAHDAVDDGKERIVLGAADILARLIVRAALANQNAAAGYDLPAESLDSEPLAVRIASVCR